MADVAKAAPVVGQVLSGISVGLTCPSFRSGRIRKLFFFSILGFELGMSSRPSWYAILAVFKSRKDFRLKTPKRLSFIAGLEMFLVVSTLVLGLIHTWAGRYSMNLDGISYLDLGDSFARHDWANALNASWSGVSLDIGHRCEFGQAFAEV